MVNFTYLLLALPGHNRLISNLNIVGIVNSSGVQVVEYSYDAWGRQVSITGSMASTVGRLNPFRYRGYVYDDETELYYLRSRYYNPEWGRFINADTLMGQVGGTFSHNLFAYCGNSPVNRLDPSGYSWINDFKEAIQNVIGIAEKMLAAVAKSAAKQASSLTKASSSLAGGVYRAIPNGLADAYTAMGNTLSTLSGIFKGVGIGLFGLDLGLSVYSNFTNNNLTTSRKITDSIVDVGVSSLTFWGAGAAGAKIGTMANPGWGTFVGFAVGVGSYVLYEHTPIGGWLKYGAAYIADEAPYVANVVGNGIADATIWIWYHTFGVETAY